MAAWKLVSTGWAKITSTRIEFLQALTCRDRADFDLSPRVGRGRTGSLGRVRADPFAVLRALGRLVDQRVGIVHAHAVGAGMLLHQGDDGVVGLLARPVALPFEQNLLPGDR